MDQQQSPIDISDTCYVPDLGSRALTNITWTQGNRVAGCVVPGPHGLLIEFHVDSSVGLGLGKDFYTLKQFHFHHPGEHRIDGKLYPLELHIVHQNYSNDSYVVLGIMLEPDPDGETLDSVDELVEHLCKMKQANCTCSQDPIHAVPLDWMPENSQDYFRYEGSLTSEPYSENVSWVVFKEPKKISPEQLDRLTAQFGHHARLPFPLHRRFVLRNFS